MKNKWNNVAMKIQNSILKKKVQGMDTFVAVLIIMAVCVVIGVMFKSQLTQLFTGWFSKLDTSVNGLF